MPDKSAESSGLSDGNLPDDYVVVARRYRPQTFVDLIGQQHVAESLEAAIQTGRVGHAYLFTGARGVGKTSAARILAKALDCTEGPTVTPCNHCEICQGVNGGEDVDVLEIDGASNRGIEEIRQLRSNANIRPSRARFKIYIIDEVHMLTREAFNALLKTLEEPPEHVKFIFCTTEPTKIPITVLSRCQRFDFAGIETDSIRERLEQIAATEGVEVTRDALELLARRAAGSMRDGQSLLEQLLALTETPINADAVHRMLGTAESARLLELASHVASADPAAALTALDAAIGEGVDEGQLIDQLSGIFRDAMVALAGCKVEAFQHTSTSEENETVVRIGELMGLETVLAVLAVLQRTQADMRYSTVQRTLAELALVRCCRLEGMQQIGTLLARLDSFNEPSTKEIKKKLSPARPDSASGTKSRQTSRPNHKSATASNDDVVSRPIPDRQRSALQPPPTEKGDRVEEKTSVQNAPAQLNQQRANELWEQARRQLSGIVLANAQEFQSVEVIADGQLRIRFAEQYKICKSVCERPENARQISEAIAAAAGQPIRLEFDLAPEPEGSREPIVPRATQRKESRLAVAESPLVRRAQELFGARPTTIEQKNN